MSANIIEVGGLAGQNAVNAEGANEGLAQDAWAIVAQNIRVADWCAWDPRTTGRGAWRSWSGHSSGEASSSALPQLPMMLRRRLTSLNQEIVLAGLACTAHVENARFVLATRHGELERTATILKALAAGEAPSPTDFSLSVHHSLVGLMSIHLKNINEHTAISAGRHTLVSALTEGACLVKATGKNTLVLFGSEPPPEPYDQIVSNEDGEDSGPFALAIVLSSHTGFPLSAADLENASLSHLKFLRGVLNAEASYEAD